MLAQLFWRKEIKDLVNSADCKVGWLKFFLHISLLIGFASVCCVGSFGWASEKVQAAKASEGSRGVIKPNRLFSSYIYHTDTHKLTDLPPDQNTNAKIFIKADHHRDIRSTLEQILQETGINISDVGSSLRPADFRLFILDMPFTYHDQESDEYLQIRKQSSNHVESEKLSKPEIHPEFPISIYEKKGHKKTEVISPWVRATLFWDEDELVGGDFIVIYSEYARARDMYNAFRGDWESLHDNEYAHDNLMVPESFVRQIIEEFQQAFPKEKGLSQFPSADEIAYVFTQKGMPALVVASMAGFSGRHCEDCIIEIGSHVGFDHRISRMCLGKSAAFYLKLYELLFRNLLDTTTITSSKGVTFSASRLQRLAESTGDYNCFIGSPIDHTSMEK